MSYPPLPKPWNLIYRIARVFVWAVFLFCLTNFALSVLFPTRSFFFDFKNSKAQGSTLLNPRTTAGDARETGHFGAGETFLINASIPGSFSDAIVTFSGNAGEATLAKGTVSVYRSQQAFFYSEGTPAAFPEGTLLRVENEYYQIAPDTTRRRFPSENAVRSEGYDPSSFLPASSEELSLNRDGGVIADISNDEPSEGSFVQSSGTYYEWRDQKLVPFVSKEAFLARFPESWALPRDISFVRARTLSDEWQGYPSGSLLSWSDGVFLVDGSSPRPILGADIFLSLGYSWDDVRPVSDEEISLTQKGKFVTFSTPQPDGTVFFDTKEQRSFLIEGGKKHEIRGEAMRLMWLGNRHPILVSSESLTENVSCTLKKVFSFSAYFSSSPTSLQCTVPLGKLAGFLGDTYEFSLRTPTDADIRHMDVSFESSLKQQTLLTTLSKLKARVLSRYTNTP